MARGSTPIYTYDSMNRLTSATGMSFQWDANGNLVYMDDGSDEWDYTYDYENRLIKVLKNDAILNRYFYDTDGRRVKVVDGQGDSLIHIYTGLNVVYEKTVSSTTKHYYANGLHIAENRGGTRVLSPRTPR